ncbi:MAG: hypothetical protein V4554_04880 [Pseudomonadota bacterium]
MKKVAIFVEGMTEQEFAVQFITALADSSRLHIVLGNQWRGKIQITGTSPEGSVDLYVLIVDCANDVQVKTQIVDQYPSLVAAGYTDIIGLRDVYPCKHTDIPKIQKYLALGLPNGLVSPQMHLAVMEIESWFLGETTHFARIHNDLTVPFIVSKGFDIDKLPCDSWEHPAKVLDDIYQLVGARYATNGRKTRRRVLRTTKALSMENLYITVRQQTPALDGFISSVEDALF